VDTDDEDFTDASDQDNTLGKAETKKEREKVSAKRKSRKQQAGKIKKEASKRSKKTRAANKLVGGEKLVNPLIGIVPIIAEEPLVLKKRDGFTDYPLFVCQEVNSRLTLSFALYYFYLCPFFSSVYIFEAVLTHVFVFFV